MCSYVIDRTWRFSQKQFDFSPMKRVHSRTFHAYQKLNMNLNQRNRISVFITEVKRTLFKIQIQSYSLIVNIAFGFLPKMN